MVKQSTKAAQALHDLQTSLNIMLQVLKNLNDSLHVVGLKGFPVSHTYSHLDIIIWLLFYIYREL